jgi:CheY-like chemotaxis protein
LLFFYVRQITSKANILAIGQIRIVRQYGKTMLEKLGFAVTIADTGEEALRLLGDLVLCDISMPGLGGLDLLDATRHHTQPPIFIMATMHNDA